MYYVFERNDGYVHAVNGQRPRDWSAPGQEPTTFTILGEFEDWNVARSTIIANMSTEALREKFGADLPWEIKAQRIHRDEATTDDARNAAHAAITALTAASTH